MQISQIKTAFDFVAFMDEIWEGQSFPLANGGVRVEIHPDYDEFRNAKRTVKLTGARRTGGSRLPDGQHADVWRWPDGTAVLVGKGGHQILLSPRN